MIFVYVFLASCMVALEFWLVVLCLGDAENWGDWLTVLVLWGAIVIATIASACDIILTNFPELS